MTDPAGWNNPSAPAYSEHSPIHRPVGLSHPNLRFRLLVVQGAAGHFEGLEPLLATPPAYLAWGNDTTYGFSKLAFKDRNHLELQFINSDTGAIMKSQVLTKAHKQRFYKL